MIKVQCSKLEQIRINPGGFAQSLKDGSEHSRGSYGMFQCWQSKVKDVHQEKLEFQNVTKALQQRFMSYADNANNRKKQEFLLDHLKPYFDAYQRLDLLLEKPQLSVKWEIIPGVSLTGYSPLLASSPTKNVAYYFTESSFLWQNQLRFPLLQYYLARYFYFCALDQVEIGVYSLKDDRFDLKSFDEQDVNIAISEARELFGKIKSFYTN